MRLGLVFVLCVGATALAAKIEPRVAWTALVTMPPGASPKMVRLGDDDVSVALGNGVSCTVQSTRRTQSTAAIGFERTVSCKHERGTSNASAICMLSKLHGIPSTKYPLRWSGDFGLHPQTAALEVYCDFEGREATSVAPMYWSAEILTGTAAGTRSLLPISEGTAKTNGPAKCEVLPTESSNTGLVTVYQRTMLCDVNGAKIGTQASCAVAKHPGDISVAQPGKILFGPGAPSAKEPTVTLSCGLVPVE